MFLIYDCFTQPSTFAKASMAVLQTLNVPNKALDSNLAFKAHGGYYGRVGRLEQFIFANVYNIYLASKDNAILLALEEDSYSNLVCAINLIEGNASIKEFIMQELQTKGIMNIDINNLRNYIAYFPQIVSNCDLAPHIKHRFSNDRLDSNPAICNSTSMYSLGFSTAIYYSGRHFECNMQGEYNGINKLFDTLGLKAITSDWSLESYYHLRSEDSIYKNSGDIIYAGIDSGVDFLCSFSSANHIIFDKHFDDCTKCSGRDRIDIATLHLAQILLVSFGKSNEACFDLHSIKPNMFLGSAKAS